MRCLLQICFALGLWGFPFVSSRPILALLMMGVWHHMWQELLCSRAGISPQELCFGPREMEQISLL